MSARVRSLPSAMDDFEKRCLRKKRPVFVEQVEISQQLLEDMKAKGLISRENMEHILSEKNNNYKVGRLFDVLLSCPLINAYDVLCAVLVKDYAWLSKELQTDSLCEKGNLTIDEDVMKEAGMLVHRKFGSSKRMSELEKKEVQDMIAMKIQVSKDDWKKEMEVLKQELDAQKHEVSYRDKKMKQLDDKLMHFIRKWDDQLTNRAHDMTTTTDFLRDTMENGDYVSKIDSQLKYLMTKIEKVFKERVTLVRERDGIMKVVGVSDDKTQLDLLIRSKLEEYPFRIEKLKTDIKDKELKIGQLKKMLADVQNELDDRELQLAKVDISTSEEEGEEEKTDDVTEKEVIQRQRRQPTSSARRERSNVTQSRQEVKNGRPLTGSSRTDVNRRASAKRGSYK